MGHAGPDRGRPCPWIGKLPLGCDPEDHVAAEAGCLGHPQKAGGAPPRVPLDAEEPDAFHEPVFAERGRVDRAVTEPVGIALPGQQKKDQRIPPARMVRVEDDRLRRDVGQARLAVLPRQHPQRMEVTAKESPHVEHEPTGELPGKSRQFVLVKVVRRRHGSSARWRSEVPVRRGMLRGWRPLPPVRRCRPYQRSRRRSIPTSSPSACRDRDGPSRRQDTGLRYRVTGWPA